MYIPNWTTNKIICKKELGDKLLTKTDEGYSLDFNKLIPMPKELKIEAGSNGEKGLIFLYLTSLDLSDNIDIRKAYKSLNPFNQDTILIHILKRLILIFQNIKKMKIFRNQLNLAKNI